MAGRVHWQGAQNEYSVARWSEALLQPSKQLQYVHQKWQCFKRERERWRDGEMERVKERTRERERYRDRDTERRRQREIERERGRDSELQPPVGPSVGSLPCITTTHLSYRLPIFETSATASCATTGNRF